MTKLQTCCQSPAGRILGSLQSPIFSVGGVGPPLQGVQIKLVNWEEGGYRASDTPPRGEIYIGAENVATGQQPFFSDPEPDPHGFALILVGWIRIRIQEGKKCKKFHTLKRWMSSFEG